MNHLPAWLLVLLSVLASSPLRADWDPEAAARYLDGRAQEWSDFAGANRGAGDTRTSCLSCHTLVPYALARPALRKAGEPTEYERKLLGHVGRRVDAWAKLDTPAYRLYYDFNDRKKQESWGTEAVLNALVLASDDRGRGQAGPSPATWKAFAHLWQAQAADGPQKGSWDWLDFGLEPWEAKNGRYYGAALAAIAVGTAPGYYTPGADAAVDSNVQLLRGYLKGNLAAQNLFNRAWALWAAAALDGVLSADERKDVVASLLARQRADGGWGLPSLGQYARGDGTPQETASDGYATGLVLHVLQTAGVGKDDPAVAKGLAWLRANQATTGAWPTASVNKKRSPDTHAGKFMTDAATAFAVLALGH